MKAVSKLIMNHQAVLRVATIQLAEGGGGAVELLNWTNYLYHVPSSELFFSHSASRKYLFPFFQFLFCLQCCIRNIDLKVTKVPSEARFRKCKGIFIMPSKAKQGPIFQGL